MKISIVVPVYNEQHAIPLFYDAINKHLSNLDFELIFINDGSNTV
ncbi:glycosyltransferase [Vibrio breoganii]|nr:glycosyltransferase [Vibrio breoganii]